MSDFDTLARPYARALFELAREQDRLDTWSAWLDAAAQVVANDDMQGLIGSPEVTGNQLAELLLSVLHSIEGLAEPTQELRNLLLLLAENGRMAALPAIAQIYETLKHDAEGVLDVQVVSARKLAAKQRKEIEKRLHERFGKQIDLKVEVDKSLLGGAELKAGDMVIDGTLRGRYEKLSTLLNK